MLKKATSMNCNIKYNCAFKSRFKGNKIIKISDEHVIHFEKRGVCFSAFDTNKHHWNLFVNNNKEKCLQTCGI